jgi:ABC-type lipopolysaccharide export system ATPase subunit
MLLGQNVTGNSLHAPMNVGYMPQEAHALNNLTAGEALYFTAHLRGLSRAEARKERDTLLALWHMGDLRDKNSAQLSRGQRRLLRLAVAMAGLMPVLILDEPTNALGPVVIPPDRLPEITLVLGRLSPATYAASALRQTVVGPVTTEIILDLTALLGMAVLFLWLAGRKMAWRQI